MELKLTKKRKTITISKLKAGEYVSIKSKVYLITNHQTQLGSVLGVDVQTGKTRFFSKGHVFPIENTGLKVTMEASHV